MQPPSRSILSPSVTSQTGCEVHCMLIFCKEKGMSDGLLHSFYTVFRFLHGVNRLQANWLVKMDFAQEWVQQFHLL